MSDTNEINKKTDIRENLANERTLLAWIRTSIGIMAFGFVVVKFSLFIRQIAILLGKDIIVPPHGHSSLIGILLVVVGAMVLILAYIKYHKTEKQLGNGNYKPLLSLVFYVTITLIIISILLILYLIENTGWF